MFYVISTEESSTSGEISGCKMGEWEREILRLNMKRSLRMTRERERERDKKLPSSTRE